ncbi:peptide-methionine (S)-S-oxide reductase [Rhizoctonia solani AG-1 IB]|uniref:peptide-methionine (S)-S-oxide reductase n=1 Tax=Thanatephorus cucumeris (strain AG1-IB / isolate 7/3/14) TaxID=1108050 RepID=M5CFR3_THACB|nr:peptide-methionine (S)-S-oxide reductase [Rhizoctonia solani AG-1 IB]
MASSDKVEVATFASGCFWGTEHIFVKHYKDKGLLKSQVGFTGGDVANPTYRQVCNKDTGHAEAARIEFDPAQLGYAELVEFFYRTHNPTTLDRQGNDVGPQYRSAIFTHSPEQERIAKEVTAEVQAKHFDPKGLKIVTSILPAGDWWAADESHQLYLFKNPNFAPADFYCFSAHRELKSVQISNGFVSTGEDEVENWMDRLPELLVFTNLTHFLFKSEAMGNNDSYIEAMTSLLESSPSLESLILNIEDVGKSAWAYSLTPVLEALGDVETEWYRFADDTTYPLRAFLVRHPRIRNFGIGLSPDSELYDGIDPDLLAELLPSVQHLAFPMFLCESVVTSKLALQIETLAITNLYLYDDDPFGPTFEVLCEDSLPKLRTLEIWASGGCEYKLETEVVEAFLLAAKELEVLDFEIQVDDIDEFESLLSTTDNLCRKSTSR